MSSRRRRTVAGASALTAIALVVTGCSGDGATTPASAESSGLSFEELNAGGQLGWEGMAVIGGGESNKLWVVDARSHKIVTSIYNEGPYNERTDESRYPNLRDAHAMLFNKDMTRMFTADQFEYGRSYVIEYDPLTLREVARVETGDGSHHIAMSPDDKYIYAANQYSDTLTVVDAATMTKVKDIVVGEGPDYISPSMYWDGEAIDSPYLFITVDGARQMTVLDWRKNEVVKQIPLPSAAHGVNLTPDGEHVWLAGIGWKTVQVYDTQTLEVVKEIETPQSPIHISLSPDNVYAYVTMGNNLIWKVDTETYETVWESQGDLIPAHTGLSPDGKELWTLNHGMDPERYPFLLAGETVQGVQVWDTDDGELVAEIPMEAMPHEIQFVPYSTFGTPAAATESS